MNSGTPEEQGVPAPLVIPIMLCYSNYKAGE